MKKRKHIWQKAFSLSCAFHLIVILTAGAMLAGFHEKIQRPPEQLITVNLADTPEEIEKARQSESPLSRLKSFLNSPAENSDSPSADNDAKSDTAKENRNENTPSADKASETPNNLPAQGEVSSPDGFLSAGGTGVGGQGEAESGGAASGESTGSGSGSESGGSGEGAGDSGGSGESLGSVAARFSQAVDSHKQYPYAAKRLGQQGTVGVYVAIDAGGSLISAQVTSSVNSNLDNAALSAVRNSCPFPHGYGGTVEMNINVNFYLN